MLSWSLAQFALSPCRSAQGVLSGIWNCWVAQGIYRAYQLVIIKAATLWTTGNCSGWSGEETLSILLPKSLKSAFCCLGCSRWIWQRLSKVSALRVMLGVLALSYMLESCLWMWNTHLSTFAKVDGYPSTLKWLLIWVLLMWQMSMAFSCLVTAFASPLQHTCHRLQQSAQVIEVSFPSLCSCSRGTANCLSDFFN